jgi:LacI family transcriptional regulator
VEKLTIHDVAKAAGVSTGTVSRALNDRAGVNAETRKHVLEVVAKMGYVPDIGARQLARGSRSVVAITRYSDTSLRNPYYTLLVDEIQQALIGSGYAVHIVRNDTELFGSGIAGAIIPGVHIKDLRPLELRERQIPFVAISLGHPQVGLASVELENRPGMLEVMDHLLQLGHRRIAHMTGSPIGQDANARLEAYKETLVRANIAFDPTLVLDGQFTELGGYKAAMKAVKTGLDFTALCCASDEMAIGALQAFKDADLRVPEDISVTGFDDLPLESFQAAQLTTVHQSLEIVARAAASLLLEQVDGGDTRTVMVRPHLVVRSTTARVRT